jgi:hypothetical protein
MGVDVSNPATNSNPNPKETLGVYVPGAAEVVVVQKRV